MAGLNPLRVAVTYAILASVFVLLLAVMEPPIQAPDEGAHFVRAEQISRGGVIARRIDPRAAGGKVSTGILVAVGRFYPLSINPDMRASRAMFAPIPWGKRGIASFPNTAIYPPFFYLPASAAVLIGKWAGWDVLQTATLMRVLTGLVSIGVGALAISLTREAAIWLFALLLLPTSAMLMAAISQDGPMLASAALAAALALRLSRPGDDAWRAELALLTILLGILGMARPPYVALALIPLAVSRPPLKARYVASASAVMLTALWCGIAAHFTMVSTDGSGAANPSAQAYYMLTHPGALLPLAANTLQFAFVTDYAGYFVSLLALPSGYYNLAGCFLALAAASAWISAGGAPNRRTMLVILAAMTSVLLVFVIQYLTWTPVGAATVRGVQGRYFLPPAAMLAAGLPVGIIKSRRLVAWWTLPVPVFPVFTIVLVICRMVSRFYV